jgi:hypothetical protein
MVDSNIRMHLLATGVTEWQRREKRTHGTCLERGEDVTVLVRARPVPVRQREDERGEDVDVRV